MVKKYSWEKEGYRNDCIYASYEPKFKCEKGSQYCSGVWCKDHKVKKEVGK
jgi:hypothetical protein